MTQAAEGKKEKTLYPVFVIPLCLVRLFQTALSDFSLFVKSHLILVISDLTSCSSLKKMNALFPSSIEKFFGNQKFRA